MFRQDVQVSNGKRYVVIECQFGHEWGMVRETNETVSEGEALEIVQYWIKYKRIKPEQIMVIEVPEQIKKENKSNHVRQGHEQRNHGRT